MLTYEDGEPVELFDHVEYAEPQTDLARAMREEPTLYTGQIVKILPRKGEVRVRCEEAGYTRRGKSIQRTLQLPIDKVTLFRRDG